MAILMIIVPFLVTLVIAIWFVVSLFQDPKSLLVQTKETKETSGTFGERLGVMLFMMLGMVACVCLPILILPGILMCVIIMVAKK